MVLGKKLPSVCCEMKVANAKFVGDTIKEEYYYWVLPLCRSLISSCSGEIFMREHLE